MCYTLLTIVTVGLVLPAAAEFVWWEGEEVAKTDFAASSMELPKLAEEASGGDWLLREKGKQGTFVEYEATVPEAGTWELYVRKFWRHGPFKWRFDDEDWRDLTWSGTVLLDQRGLGQWGWNLSWVPLGRVELAAGSHRMRIEMTDAGSVAAFDAFCLTQGRFQPRGKAKPDEPLPPADPGWVQFGYRIDPEDSPALDLRKLLNEPQAGSRGFITAKGEDFVYPDNGDVIRFWADNCGGYFRMMPHEFIDSQARMYARRGINLMRLHGPLTSDGRISGTCGLEVYPPMLDGLFYTVDAFKKQGIYSKLSFFFGTWFDVREHLGIEAEEKIRAHGWHTYSTKFMDYYKQWFETTLNTVNPYSGKKLKDDPAVMCVELVNEWSTLWYNNFDKLPVQARAHLEDRYEEWLIARYGSIDACLKAWGGGGSNNLAESGARRLVGFWDIQSAYTSRANDQWHFLADLQRQFNEEMVNYIKNGIGYRGMVLAGNWHPINDYTMGGLQQWSEKCSDFYDRHGYFSAPRKKDEGDRNRTFPVWVKGRSAVRAEGFGNAGKVLDMVFLDMTRDGKPSMVSEFHWTGKNRFRTEMPLFTSALTAAAGMDATVNFSMHNVPGWLAVDHGHWPIQTPGVLGQYPAAAVMFRLGAIKEGKVLAAMRMNTKDALKRKARPVTKPSRFDFNARLGSGGAKEERVTAAAPYGPVYFCTGKVTFDVGDFPTASELQDIDQYWDENKQLIHHSNGQIEWDYGKGLFEVHAEGANAVVGFLNVKDAIDLPDVTIKTPLEFGAIALVSLDKKPLAESKRMLLQVMSEQRATGWTEGETDAKGFTRIIDPGGYPMQTKALEGAITFKREDAQVLRITPLHENFVPAGPATRGPTLVLRPDVFYYLIEGIDTL